MRVRRGASKRARGRTCSPPRVRACSVLHFQCLLNEAVFAVVCEAVFAPRLALLRELATLESEFTVFRQ